MTKIFWSDAVTYIKQIDERPSFTEVDLTTRKITAEKFIFTHYHKPIEYMVRYKNKIILYNNSSKDEPKEIEFTRVTPDDDLTKIQTQYVWLDIPSMKMPNTKDWIFHAFSVLKNAKIHARLSGTKYFKFPWYSVEINARRIAGFKQLVMPNNIRVDIQNIKSIIGAERYLKSFGYSMEQIQKANMQERIKINMKSYETALAMTQNPKKHEQNLQKIKKPRNTINKNAKMGLAVLSDEKKKEIASIGGKTKAKNALINKLENFCVNDPQFSHLAPYFSSRDPEFMLQALGEIMSIDSQRYLRGVKHEQETYEGAVNPNVTNLSDNLFKHAESLARLIKPGETGSPTYNILNYKVNVGVAVENLNNAGLTQKQRDDLATEIDSIIKEQKRARTLGTEVVTPESTVSGETN